MEQFPQATSLRDLKTKLSRHGLKKNFKILNTASKKNSLYCFKFFIIIIIAVR